MAKNSSRGYGNDSISSLKGADRVRKRPGSFSARTGWRAVSIRCFEILSNSIDEAREGRGNKIILTKYKDCSYEVTDYGCRHPGGF